MITVKELKKILNDYPDDATAIAYEGEQTGIAINYGNKSGWIETGTDQDTPVDPEKHEKLNR